MIIENDNNNLEDLCTLIGIKCDMEIEKFHKMSLLDIYSELKKEENKKLIVNVQKEIPTSNSKFKIQTTSTKTKLTQKQEELSSFLIINQADRENSVKFSDYYTSLVKNFCKEKAENPKQIKANYLLNKYKKYKKKSKLDKQSGYFDNDYNKDNEEIEVFQKNLLNSTTAKGPKKHYKKHKNDDKSYKKN